MQDMLCIVSTLIPQVAGCRNYDLSIEPHGHFCILCWRGADCWPWAVSLAGCWFSWVSCSARCCQTFRLLSCIHYGRISGWSTSRCGGQQLLHLYSLSSPFSWHPDKYVYLHELKSTSYASCLELIRRLRALTLVLLPVEVEPSKINEPTSRTITPQVISAYRAAAGDFGEAVSSVRSQSFALPLRIPH